MCPLTPAVALLPLWPIAGIEFSPSSHLRHILVVFGCHEGCPAIGSNLPYYGSVYANTRNSVQTFQVPTPYMRIVEALWDFSAELVDHPIDADLIYPYVCIHSSPVNFASQILIYIPTFQCVRYFHVSNIHLRWSEMQRVLKTSAMPPLVTSVKDTPSTPPTSKRRASPSSFAFWPCHHSPHSSIVQLAPPLRWSCTKSSAAVSQRSPCQMAEK